MIDLISLCEEVREALKKQTKLNIGFDPFNKHPELITVYWERFENDCWPRTDHYKISFEVIEEATKNYSMTIKKYLDLSSRENPGGKTEKDGTRKFKIGELNDIDAVIAKIKEEIPFVNFRTQTQVFTHCPSSRERTSSLIFN